jgi:sterol desaturase/sphingolipid hydroxylase (fatty acid hydroxylase superfamily)
MTLLKIEHSKVEYYADFGVYLLVIILAAGYLAGFAPRAAWPEIAAVALSGLIGFSLLEYAVHRFIFHGLEPFKSWHAEHHRRPQALIGTPTIVTVAILVVCIFLPVAAIGDRWLGTALSLGMAAGFLGYGWLHHSTHHARAKTRWMKNRKRVHAVHHASGGVCLYGVTTSVWDHLFGSVHLR